MSDNPDDELNRRWFLGGAAATAGALAVAETAWAAGGEPRAVDDPGIMHGPVELSARGVDGYLARPKAPGRHPAVIVVPGTWIQEPYIPETAAKLAQAGFVGLVVNIYHLFPKVKDFAATRDVPWEVTQEIVRTKITDDAIVADLNDGSVYLKRQSFVRPERFGVLGFCGGGRNAMFYSWHSPDIAAVVPFYAPVISPPVIADRPSPFDWAAKIKAPLQAHYGTLDKNIPMPDVHRFAAVLAAQGTDATFFYYEAEHGFMAYNRNPEYNPEAARLAWQRSTAFLRTRLAG
jgi:carboxymethylenebutenolidase